MLLNVRKFLLGFALSLFLLPMVAFASAEYKGKEMVQINKADAATFAAYLKKIGPNKAKAIVNFRKANGSFKKITDIKNVPGIGDETYKAIQRNISTSRGKSTAPTGYKLGESSGKSKSTKKKPTRKKTTSSNSSSSSSSKAKNSRAKKVTESSSSSSSTPKKSKTKKPKLKRKTSSTSSSTSASTSKKPAKKKKKIKKTKKKSS